MKKQQFFLFGEQAVATHDSDMYPPNFGKIKVMIENGEAALFFYEEGITTPEKLLSEYNGFENFIEITEEDYKKLSDL